MATRKSSQVAMSVFGKYMPELIGGSADLKGSNLSYLSKVSNMYVEMETRHEIRHFI